MKHTLDRILTLLGVVTVGAVLVLPVAGLAQQPAADRQPMAVVNGVMITRGHFEIQKRLLRAALPLLNEQVVGLIAGESLSNAELLDCLIDRELIIAQAQAAQIKIFSRQVADALSGLKTRLGDTAAFQRYLEYTNMSEAQLSQQLQTALMVRRYLQSQVIQRVRVGDPELKNFYARHPEDFIRGEQVRALHLLVAVSDQRSREEALGKILDIEADLARGADFAITAMTHSDCSSGAKGGDLGYFDRSQVIAPVAEAAFRLQPGQTSAIIESPLGFHMVKLLDRIPPSQIPFRDVRDKIERTIRRNKENQAVRTHLDRLRKEAEIVRYSSLP